MKPRSEIDWGLLVLRTGLAALLFGLHGVSKLAGAFHYFASNQAWGLQTLIARLGLPAPTALALFSTLAESAAAIVLAVGYSTRIAAFIIALNLLGALYAEITLGGVAELPAAFLLGIVTILIAGPGQIAMDGRRPTYKRRR
jgi:putative oxidoreductase